MTHSRFFLGGACLLTLAMTLSGCTSEENAAEATTETPAGSALGPMSAEVQAQVDSGNMAYRDDDYESALAYFRAALEDDPERPAPLYGVYLASAALGDTALADSAAAVLQERAPFLLDGMAHSVGDTPADPHGALMPLMAPDSQADTTR